MDRLVLMSVGDETKQKVGHLILLFAQVEWFSANVIYYAQMSPAEYQQLGNHPIGTKYLHTLFQLDFYKKLDLLKSVGFDTANLKKVQKYRSIITHGLVFNENGILSASKPHKSEIAQLSEVELDQNITILEDEGGKLRKFMEEKGYKLSKPKPAETSVNSNL